MKREVGEVLTKRHSEVELVAKARQRIRSASTQAGVRDILADVAIALFPAINRVSFAVLRKGFIELEHPPDELPDRKVLPKWRGHVGLVLKNRRSHYEAQLREDDRYFARDSRASIPRTVFTLPCRWDWEDLPGAVQLQSQDTEDACQDLKVRRLFEEFVTWAGSEAVKLELKSELRGARLRAESNSGWREEALDIVLGRDQLLTTILRTKRIIIKGFADELKRVGGEACVAASVRALNPLSRELSYSVCVGDAWTAEARESLYAADARSAGRAAMESHAAIYHRDVEKAQDYYRVLPQTKSLWLKSFAVQGELRGVVSADFDVLDGCPETVQQSLEALVVQFEGILDAVSAKEGVLFRDLEQTVASGDKAQLQQMSRMLAEVFGAEHCSIFVDREGRRELTLLESTHRRGRPEIRRTNYKFGEGITGWVASERRPVNIRHSGDQAELDRVAGRYKIKRRISHTKRAGSAGTESVLAAPMVARGRVIGVIRLGGVPSNEFAHEDEVFLQEIANRLGQEFDRVWIEQEAKMRIARLEQGAGFVRAQKRATGFDDSVKVALDEAVFSTNADGGYIRIEDGESGIQAVRTSGFLESLQDERLLATPVGSLFSKDIWIDHAWFSLRQRLQTKFEKLATVLVRSGAVLHLLKGDSQATAVCILCFRDPPAWPAVREIRNLEERISSGLRPALRMARLEQRLRKELESSTRLKTIALAYAAANNVEDLAEAVLDTVRTETGMTRGVVRLYDPATDTWSRIAPGEVPGEDLEVFPASLKTNHALRQCMESQVPIFTNEVQSKAGWINDWSSEPNGPRKDFLMGIQSWLAVPMWLQGRFLGAILLQSEEKCTLGADALQHLEVMAPYAATAIHSAQTLQGQLDTIQPFAVVGTMLGGFLHNMRNELSAAHGFCDNVLSFRSLPHAASERLAKLRASLNAIGGICRDFVSFDPKAQLNPEELDVNAVLDEAWLDLSRTINPEAVELKRRYSSDRPMIRGNRIQIETAFRMLLQNSLEALATDATPGRKGVLRLETRIRKSGWRDIRIADSGGGMTKETRHRAFRPLFTTKQTGNGLGLAIVWQVAKGHGAKILLATEKGWGTSVTLRFPRRGNN